MRDLTHDALREFDRTYSENRQNKIIENAIKNVGINKFCLDNDVLRRTYNIFNIELPKSKIYNQGDSGRCWIYAGLNLIKNNVAQNLGVAESEYALSANYLAFLDKLEKSNTLYNQVIERTDFDLATELDEGYLQLGVYEGGYFEYFRALVKKYGLVPEKIMPDTQCSKSSSALNQLFNDKVKKDIYKLLDLKQRQPKALEITKMQMLQENYNLLAKCLGEVPFKFDYENRTTSGKYLQLTDLTPQEFAQRYLTIDLDNFVGIANLPMYNKSYGKLYRKKYSENVYRHSEIEFVNLPISDLKQLAIQQLRDGMPVYFGGHIDKMRDNTLGILDANLYNYREAFQIDLLTKEEALSLSDISYQHVMLLTGVHLEKNKPVRWKVEDSFSDQVHQDGYYVMNDNFFDDFIMEVFIDKKYLNPERLAFFTQQPILFGFMEPFGGFVN